MGWLARHSTEGGSAGSRSQPYKLVSRTALSSPYRQEGLRIRLFYSVRKRIPHLCTCVMTLFQHIVFGVIFLVMARVRGPKTNLVRPKSNSNSRCQQNGERTKRTGAQSNHWPNLAAIEFFSGGVRLARQAPSNRRVDLIAQACE